MHPAVKYFRKRKQGQTTNMKYSYSKSSNPQRVEQKRRQKARDKYNFEPAQYEYYNQRQRVARKVFTPGERGGGCPVPITDIESYYKSLFEVPNELTLEHYPISEQQANIVVTTEEINKAIKSIKIDTSAGYDRVLARTIRDLKIGPTIKKLIDIMLATGTVPNVLSEWKTILIPKGGDSKILTNWRPITIYSVLRHTIEKVLDRHLRSQVVLNHNQRGFTSNLPGCHINTRLVNACLLKAKREKADCVIAFLDVSKAFDKIGHSHINDCLVAQGVAHNLRRLVMSLLKNNTIKVDIGKARTGPTRIARSVPQGGPLSPTLFNITINFLYDEIRDSQFVNQHGFVLTDGLDSIGLSGFADDQAVTARSEESARRLIELVRNQFDKIGLQINPAKSSIIRIVKGKLLPGDMIVDDFKISCITDDTPIKYLGCTFIKELLLDQEAIKRFVNSCNNLITSPLLKPDQKLNLMSQYLFATLTYPLQTAPLRKIPLETLRKLDKTIHNTVKSVVGLPTSTSTQMLNAPRKYRGLGILVCEWEAFLQHFAIARKLSTIDDELFHSAYDCEQEMEICKNQLNVSEGNSSKEIRTILRERAADNWAAQEYQGLGVIHFKVYPKANAWVCDKNRMSSSEWTCTMKLSTGYANLAGVLGNWSRAQNDRCRRCGREKETLPHVLGNYHFNDLRRNQRHHDVKHTITKLLQEKGYTCYEEVLCYDNRSNRFADIVAFEPNSDRAYIIDPTIRYETNEDRGVEVQNDKEIYTPCISDLQRRYGHFGPRQFQVIGLWFGARGAITQQVLDFWNKFDLDKKHLPVIAEDILVASIKMLHHHLYQ